MIIIKYSLQLNTPICVQRAQSASDVRRGAGGRGAARAGRRAARRAPPAARARHVRAGAPRRARAAPHRAQVLYQLNDYVLINPGMKLSR